MKCLKKEEYEKRFCFSDTLLSTLDTTIYIKSRFKYETYLNVIYLVVFADEMFAGLEASYSLVINFNFSEKFY